MGTSYGFVKAARENPRRPIGVARVIIFWPSELDRCKASRTNLEHWTCTIHVRGTRSKPMVENDSKNEWDTKR
jgi:hypothetical protein